MSVHTWLRVLAGISAGRIVGCGYRKAVPTGVALDALHWRRKLIMSCLMLCMLVVGGGAQASPSDVRGSGNVAVKAYTNSAGSFVLWSNGRITSLEGKEVNKESAYDSYSGAKLPTRIGGNILGSSLVAVSAFSTDDATCVLFSDGTVKKPRNSDAASPAIQSRRVVCGVNVARGDTKSGPLGWKCQQVKAQLSIWAGMTNNVLEIVFNKAFKAPPVFLCTIDNYLVENRYPTNERIKNYECSSCMVTAKKVLIFGPDMRQGKSAYVPWHITFAAFEEE